jgi:hypothetical protein
MGASRQGRLDTRLSPRLTVRGLYESASGISPLRPVSCPLTSTYLQTSTLVTISMHLFSLLLLLLVVPLALAHAPSSPSNSTLETRAPRKPFNPPIPESGLRPVTGTLHERSPRIRSLAAPAAHASDALSCPER